jgi:hypothetical protein
MTVQQLIQLAQNKLTTLQQSRQWAWEAGNAESVSSLDIEIAQTQDTLARLQTLI